MSGGGTHSVKRHLDVDAEGYDVQIRRFIPHYDDMIATGVELLVALAPVDGHVLDVGGGTGALSSAVLEGLPGVRVTVLDVDPDMLGEARRRLALVPAESSHQVCAEEMAGIGAEEPPHQPISLAPRAVPLPDNWGQAIVTV
jgi:protein-L-isoaspartate O-methyltransferase